MFNSNGGSSASSQTVDPGSTITLPNTTRSGYNLVGWFTSSGNKAGFAGDKYTVYGDITLDAQWASANSGMPWQGKTVTNLNSSTTYTTGTSSSDIVTDGPWYRVTITGSITNPVPIVRLRDKKSYGSCLC